MSVLTASELESRAATASELAQRAAAMITDPAREPVRSLKDGVADWVTPTDLAVERLVRDLLGQRFPDDGIVGEELENAPLLPGRPVWYVDPVDGTANFAHGLRSCSFSLAVADDAGMAVGFVADVWRQEVFSAVRGQGARCATGAARCRSDTTLTGGLVLTELAGAAPWGGMTDLIGALGRQACATRILGSSALTLANVGAGRASAAVLGRAHPIDVAAGALIARESGAIVSVGTAVDRVLGPDELGPWPALVAAAPGVYAQLLRTLRVTGGGG
jgi:fructose-1,6-bisphosphatase/inositol monophosphatase family enzyme